MWLGPALFIAVNILLWRYVGAVFVPEVLARSVLRVAGAAEGEVILINMAILYFGAYFAFAVFWKDQTIFEECVFCGDRLVAGEYPDDFSTPGEGNTRIQISPGMDVGQSAAASLSLDVRARAAVSGQTIVKLILGVFGIAALLIVVWILLWMLAMRDKK